MSQFRIKNGLIIDNGGIAVTGSISSTAGITGSFSGSIAGFPTDVSAFSSSLSTRITATEATSSAFVTASGSLAARLASNEAKTGSFATTGSNYFIGTQTITGSVYITSDLIVQGSSSLQNITASAVSIGTNTVILNTDTPILRFGGISVQDSGSTQGRSGSLFWDSVHDHWIYVVPSGSSEGYNSAMLMNGPKNTGSLGSETGLTSGYIPRSQGEDHLEDSNIFSTGSNIGINTSTVTEGTQVASSLSIFPSSSVSGGPLIQFASNGRIRPASVGDRLSIDGNALYLNSTFSSTVSIAAGGGNVGIGTTNPSGTYGKLSVAGGIRILDDNNGKLEIGRYSSGASNSYIKLGSNSNSLRFTNNDDSADLLYLTNSGSLGLGTTPSAWTTPFTVIQGGSYGQHIGFQSNGPDMKLGTNNYYYGGSYLYTISSYGAAQLNVSGNSGLQFNVAPAGNANDIIAFTSSLAITNAGNVGIGITNPNTKLQVVGSDSDGITISGGTNGRKIVTTSTSVDFYTTTIDAGWAMGIYSKKSSDSTVLSSIAGAYGGSANTLAYNFYGGTDYTNAAIYIPTSKNVGIGTTSPNVKLEVLDTSTSSGEVARFQRNLDQINEYAYIKVGNASYPGYFGSMLSTYDIAYMSMSPNPTDGKAICIRTVDGNVGIGTISPAAKLHIENSSVSYGNLRLLSTSNSGGESSIHIGRTDQTLEQRWTVGQGVASIGDSFGFYTGGAPRLTLNTSGHLTLPYQPAFYAWYSGGNSTRTTGAFTSFNSTRVNRGSHYNTSNGRFTAPIAGVYEFIFSLLWRNDSGDTGAGEISLGVNGSNLNARGMAYSSSPGTNGYHTQTLVRAVLSLSAGDYVTGWIHVSGTSVGNWYFGENLGYFSGYLLG